MYNLLDLQNYFKKFIIKKLVLNFMRFLISQLILIIIYKNDYLKELHIIFVNIIKTYDSVPRVKLWEILNRSSVSTQHAKALKGNV